MQTIIMENDGDVIALTWFLHNACTSNVELAIVSNVCRRWREVAVVAVVAVASNDGGKKVIDAPSSSSSEPTSPLSSSTGNSPQPSSCIRRLIVTDMAREVGVSYHHSRHKQGNLRNCKQLNGCDTAEAEDSSFCLAWFAPSGIQTMAVSTDNGADNDDNGNDKEYGDKDNQTHQSNGRGGKSDKMGNNVVCCPEWRGYRHATEVLFPFDYTTCFIRVCSIESMFWREMFTSLTEIVVFTCTECHGCIVEPRKWRKHNLYQVIIFN
jgi:hypothetical protein